MLSVEIVFSTVIYIFWQIFDEVNLFFDFLWGISYMVFLEYCWIALKGKKVIFSKKVF